MSVSVRGLLGMRLCAQSSQGHATHVAGAPRAQRVSVDRPRRQAGTQEVAEAQSIHRHECGQGTRA
eukprot:9197760-Alexandrium_andersonii.AAC.1